MSSEKSEKKHYGSFEEFWPDYVRAHSNRTNRRLHFIGSTLGVICSVTGIALRRPLLFLAGPVIGYGFSWVGHFVFEKNTPASFSNPLHSFRADWVMWSKIANGTMDAEVERFVSGDGAGVDDAAHANGAPPVDATTN